MTIHCTRAIALSLLLSVLGCTTTTASEKINDKEVTWESGFRLSALLATPITANHVEDISTLITAPWYDYFTFDDNKNNKVHVYSCQDYFSNENNGLILENYNDINPFLTLNVQCEAAKYLIDTQPSQVTYLPISPLDKALPLALPKEIALQTSTNEYKRTMSDETLTFWGDIRPIIRFESISDSKAIYHFDGGYQEIEIVGRGDVNHDKVEDLIIVIRDSLEGGSYFNLRLFILSFNKNREWSVIEER